MPRSRESLHRTLSISFLTFALSLPAAARSLSFDDRVRAQEAIERIYQLHRSGGSEPIPRPVLEGKVREYLKRSALLERRWKIPVTARALERELARIARDTALPGRLAEIYQALGNDPLLLQECLARPALVERLTRSFFAYDPLIHAASRAEAEDARSWMVRGRLDLESAGDRWRVIDVALRGADAGSAPAEIQVDAAGLARWRARVPADPGEVGPVVEHRDAFSVRVLLADEGERLRIGTYAVTKRRWSDWWDGAVPAFEEADVPAVASPDVALPVPRSAGRDPATEGTLSCVPEQLWDNGLLDDIPEPRLMHTAIWTGSEMIVWGGTGILPQVDTGGRYDPATDTWSTMTTTNAPAARRRHTAVWTGTEMLVWGGTDGTDLDTGGRYDPAADTWTPMSQVLAPTGRTGHSFVWTGTEAIVWGGENDGRSVGLGGRYRPDLDAWTPVSNLGQPVPRSGHSAVWTGTWMVIWGGNSAGASNSGGRYDPSTDTWLPMDSSNEPLERFSQSTVWTGTEMIIWGGSAFASALDSGGRYDPVADVWTLTTRLGAPSPRREHSAVWTGSRMIVWGGASGSNVNTGGIYDPATDSWEPTGRSGAPSPRSLHSAVWTGNVMVVWGGSQLPGLNTSGGRYDPASDSWTPTATPNGQTGRRNHIAVWTGSEMIAWGGFDTLPPNYLDTGGRYDPVMDMWFETSLVDAPSPRELHDGVWTGTEMIVWGGFDGTTYLDTGGRYDPLTDSWSPTTQLGAPSARQHPSALWTGSEMILWGGFWNVYLRDGARYDPATDSWTPVSSVGAPLERYLHSAVWTGTEMMIWGGTSTITLAPDGGRYDPVADAWTPMAFRGAPAPRNRHSAVWTGEQMVVWGGFDGFTYFDDGGRYDPAANAWLPLSTENPPEGRLDHSVVWTGSRMLVWGGFDESAFPYLGTGGRYDPVADRWELITLERAPSPRNDHTAVWMGDRMIIWGGSDGSVLNTGGRYLVGDFPGEATGLTFDLPGQTLSWFPALGPDVTHQVLRGEVSELPVGAGPSEACIASGVSSSIPEPEVPALGVMFWYLVRGVNVCAAGSYGTGPGGAPRTSATCP